MKTKIEKLAAGVKRDPDTGLLPSDAPVSITRQARALIDEYQVIIWREDGEFYGQCVEMPGCMGDGKTPADCLKQTRAAMLASIETDLMLGHLPPAPTSETGKTEQINIRLGKREKIFIEAAAKRRGYKGVSDYARACLLKDLQTA